VRAEVTHVTPAGFSGGLGSQGETQAAVGCLKQAGWLACWAAGDSNGRVASQREALIQATLKRLISN